MTTEGPKTIYAVHMSSNRDPSVKEQWCDVGKTAAECVKAAELYCSTSRYQIIEVVELQIIWVVRAK